MEQSLDEVIRALEREIAVRPEGELLSRLALALARAGRSGEAFHVAARALAADPSQPCRELVPPDASAYGSGSVPWKAPVGSPRLLASRPPWQLHPPVDLGGGVLVFGREPGHERLETLTEIEDAPGAFTRFSEAGINLTAVDFLSDRVVFRGKLPGVKHLIAAASGDKLFAVREPREREPEIVLLDARTGAELASRVLDLDPRALARLPSRIAPTENPLRWAFALASRHGQPFAIVAGDTVPRALREPPFDLPCLLFPEALTREEAWTSPPWTGPFVAGESVALSVPDSPYGVSGYDRNLQRTWRAAGAVVLGTCGDSFVLRGREEQTIQVVDGASGILLRERTFLDMPGYMPRQAFAAGDTLVVEPFGYASVPLFGLDPRTLATRWHRRADLDALGSGDSVCMLDVAMEPGHLTVTVLDAGSGRETRETILPLRYGAATPLYLGGKLFVISSEATYCLDG